MKTSELIEFLQESLAKNGDLEIGTLELETGSFRPTDCCRIIDEDFIDEYGLDYDIDLPFVYIGFRPDE